MTAQCAPSAKTSVHHKSAHSGTTHTDTPSFLFLFLFLFLLTETHQKQSAAQRVTCVSQSAHVRAQPCLKFQVGSCSAQRGFAPGLSSLSRSILARTDGVFRYVRLPRRVERSSSQDRLFEAELRGHLLEAAWYGFTGTQWYVLWSYFLNIPLPASPSLVPLVVFSLFARFAQRWFQSWSDCVCTGSLLQ